MQEGSNWQAAGLAGHRKLCNLTVIVDRNRLQQSVGTEETMTMAPLDDRFWAFCWDVGVVDGQDHVALLAVLSAVQEDKPCAVIANMTKDKGVSFMKNQAKRHHGAPNSAQFAEAMEELV